VRQRNVTAVLMALMMIGGAPGIAQGHSQYGDGAAIVRVSLFSGPGVRIYSTYEYHAADTAAGCAPDHLVKLVTAFTQITTTKAYLKSVTAYYEMEGLGALSGGALSVSTGNSGESYSWFGDTLAHYYYNSSGWAGVYTVAVNHWFTYSSGQLHIYVIKHTDTSNYTKSACHHDTADIYLRNN
jgi:hypothetical protein